MMMMDPFRERLAAAKVDVERLKSSIESRKAALANGSLSSLPAEGRKQLSPALRRRRVLQGHFNKIYAMAWAGDGERLVSGRCVALFFLTFSFSLPFTRTFGGPA